ESLADIRGDSLVLLSQLVQEGHAFEAANEATKIGLLDPDPDVRDQAKTLLILLGEKDQLNESLLTYNLLTELSWQDRSMYFYFLDILSRKPNTRSKALEAAQRTL